jgi:probable rRNA maturation factor
MPLKKIRKAARDVLNALGCPESELSILIVDDHEIATYNQQYLNRTGPTNVLAFPMQEGEFSDVTPELLGDVVISVETTEKEAENSDITFDHRFYELLIHGILHLLGYDHEKDDGQAERMEKKTKELLSVLGIEATSKCGKMNP